MVENSSWDTVVSINGGGVESLLLVANVETGETNGPIAVDTGGKSEVNVVDFGDLDDIVPSETLSGKCRRVTAKGLDGVSPWRTGWVGTESKGTVRLWPCLSPVLLVEGRDVIS